jgi:anti-sigma factor (TIGR02949 family)
MLALINLYTCREALDRLNDYLDRELSPREMQLVARHLKICRQCTHKFTFEAELLTELRAKVAHLDMPSDLMDRISASLSAEEA